MMLRIYADMVKINRAVKLSNYENREGIFISCLNEALRNRRWKSIADNHIKKKNSFFEHIACQNSLHCPLSLYKSGFKSLYIFKISRRIRESPELSMAWHCKPVLFYIVCAKEASELCMKIYFPESHTCSWLILFSLLVIIMLDIPKYMRES